MMGNVRIECNMLCEKVHEADLDLWPMMMLGFPKVSLRLRGKVYTWDQLAADGIDSVHGTHQKSPVWFHVRECNELQ